MFSIVMLGILCMVLSSSNSIMTGLESTLGEKTSGDAGA